MTDFVEKLEDRFSARSDPIQRNPEENGKQQHLEDLALGERVDHRAGNDVQEELFGAVGLRRRRVAGDRLGVECGRIGVNAGSRLQHIDDDETDDERKRRHRLKINQGLDSNPADIPHVPHLGDADHNGAER